MKKILSALLFLLCVSCSSLAGQRITATITVTNTPSDGDTIAINSDTRTFRTSPSDTATEITIGSDIGENATNLFNQFSGTRFTTLQLNRSGTNGVTLAGIVDQAMSVSISGTWGEYSLSTNSITSAAAITTPASAYPSQSVATNTYSKVVSDLEAYSTNALSEGTTLVENLVQIASDQAITGAKTFTGANTYSNAVFMHFNGSSSLTLTNGLLFTQVSGASANDYYLIEPDGFGYPSLLDASGNAPTDLPDSLAGLITYNQLILFFPQLGGFFSHPTNSWTAYNKFDWASANTLVSSNSTIYAGQITANLTNTTAYAGGAAITTISSLTTGNNAGVDTTGYRLVKLTAGPAGAFSICGLAGGGVRELDIYNNTGQNMTIAHQSGVEPVSTNRIVSLTGADQTTTGDGWAHLVYDTTASRWILTYLSQ